MPRSILIQRRLRLILPCRSAAYEATSKRTQTNIKVSLCGVLQGGEPVPSKKEWIQKLLAKPGDKDLLGFLSCCDIALSAGQGTMLWHLKQQLVPDEARLGHTFVQRPASLFAFRRMALSASWEKPCRFPWRSRDWTFWSP